MKCEFNAIEGVKKCQKKVRWHIGVEDPDTYEKGEPFYLCNEHSTIVTYVLDIYGVCWWSKEVDK